MGATLDSVALIVYYTNIAITRTKDDNMTQQPITSELLEALTIAQLKHVHEMTTSDGEYSGIQNALHSDDSYDYLRAALNLGSTLLTMQYDADLAGFAKLLDPRSDEFVFENHACDGICDEIMAALPSDWEDQFDDAHDFRHKRLSDCDAELILKNNRVEK